MKNEKRHIHHGRWSQKTRLSSSRSQIPRSSAIVPVEFKKLAAANFVYVGPARGAIYQSHRRSREYLLELGEKLSPDNFDQPGGSCGILRFLFYRMR